jgi:hypothetical protein
MAQYATVVSLEAYLGRALTDAESDGADAACAAATDLIDGYTGRTWQTATVTGELHTVLDKLVRLDSAPVSAITSVTSRYLTAGETPTTLVADVDYELLDATNGILLVNAYRGTTLTVAYTRPATVPPSITQAANIIAASWLVGVGAIDTRAAGLTQLTAGSVTLKWQLGTDAAASIPGEAKALLAPYRNAVLFA